MVCSVAQAPFGMPALTAPGFGQNEVGKSSKHWKPQYLRISPLLGLTRRINPFCDTRPLLPHTPLLAQTNELQTNELAALIDSGKILLRKPVEGWLSG